MKYLSSSPFSVGVPSKLFPGTCEKCIYGSGDHAKECPNRTYTKIDYYVPMAGGSVTRMTFIGTVLVEVEEDCPVTLLNDDRGGESAYEDGSLE